MSTKRDVPEPWAKRMVKMKFINPRNGQASMRALAEEVGSTTTTISEMMYGGRNTQGDLVRKVATALGVTPMEIARWIGRRATAREPFEAHPDADLLTDAEQRAINELIRSIAAPRKPRQRLADATSIPEAIELRKREAAADEENFADAAKKEPVETWSDFPDSD